MKRQLPLWDKYTSWQSAEAEWEKQKAEAEKKQPIESLRKLPMMQGITPQTKKHLKWKSLYWMLTQDHEKKVLKGFLRHPIKYFCSFIRSCVKKGSYVRDGDFFYYGISNLQAFEDLLKRPDTLFVLGFSYCHKPFECPSGRFNSDCIHSASNPVCRQCFIGKAFHALPKKRSVALVIPTVHYIGGEIFNLVHAHPDKQVVFIITACEMTLEMFGDWGNMAGIKGIGVRLDGRICNTMKAFELSERGIKPGLTVVLPETQEKILSLIRSWRNESNVSV